MFTDKHNLEQLSRDEMYALLSEQEATIAQLRGPIGERVATIAELRASAAGKVITIASHSRMGATAITGGGA